MDDNNKQIKNLAIKAASQLCDDLKASLEREKELKEGERQDFNKDPFYYIMQLDDIKGLLSR